MTFADDVRPRHGPPQTGRGTSRTASTSRRLLSAELEPQTVRRVTMLGHHPMLRHELEKNGHRAFAKVREAKKTHYYEAVGTTPAQEVANTRVLWKLVLHVEPEGE